MSAFASLADWGQKYRASHLAEIADELAELVQLMSAETSAKDANTRQEVAPQHLAEMEIVIEAAFAHVRERADADFFTLPAWAATHYAANWQ
jgi:hypothetical protein